MVDLGLKCCLIGHSERRGEFGLPTPKESDELLATKAAYILEKGLLCVYCIGEPLPLREKGLEALMAEAIIPQLQVLVPLLKGLEDKSRVRMYTDMRWRHPDRALPRPRCAPAPSLPLSLGLRQAAIALHPLRPHTPSHTLTHPHTPSHTLTPTHPHTHTFPRTLTRPLTHPHVPSHPLAGAHALAPRAPRPSRPRLAARGGGRGGRALLAWR